MDPGEGDQGERADHEGERKQPMDQLPGHRCLHLLGSLKRCKEQGGQPQVAKKAMTHRAVRTNTQRMMTTSASRAGPGSIGTPRLRTGYWSSNIDTVMSTNMLQESPSCCASTANLLLILTGSFIANRRSSRDGQAALNLVWSLDTSFGNPLP